MKSDDFTCLQASSYRCATTESIKEAIHDGSDVLFYAGGGDESHLVVEAPNGLSTRLEKDDVLQLLSGGECLHYIVVCTNYYSLQSCAVTAKSTMKKLVIVISPSRKPGKANNSDEGV